MALEDEFKAALQPSKHGGKRATSRVCFKPPLTFTVHIYAVSLLLCFCSEINSFCPTALLKPNATHRNAPHAGSCSAGVRSRPGVGAFCVTLASVSF